MEDERGTSVARDGRRSERAAAMGGPPGAIAGGVIGATVGGIAADSIQGETPVAGSPNEAGAVERDSGRPSPSLQREVRRSRTPERGGASTHPSRGGRGRPADAGPMTEDVQGRTDG